MGGVLGRNRLSANDPFLTLCVSKREKGIVAELAGRQEGGIHGASLSKKTAPVRARLCAKVEGSNRCLLGEGQQSGTEAFNASGGRDTNNFHVNGRSTAISGR